MRIFVNTCDKYDHLLPGFAHLFNKYWGCVPVTVLGFRPPPPLPSNFDHIILPGVQTDWTSARRTVIESLPLNETICWLLDDYWFCAPVHRTIVTELEAAVRSGELAKGDLTDNSKNLGCDPYVHHPGYVLAKQTAHYRSSTQAAIWSRDYLLKLLRPVRTIWEFEIEGTGLCSNDGAKIAGYDPQPCRYANIYYKGGIDNFQVDKLAAADVHEMYAAGICRNILEHAYVLKRTRS